MPTPSWSFSKLGDFEKCKRMFWLKHDQKIPEPERPLPPGKTEHANDRGTRIHESCELYINGTSKELAPEAELHFGFHIELLRVMFKDGLVSLEGEWGMNRGWEPCGWNGDWEEIEKPDIDVVVTKVKELPKRGDAAAVYAIAQGRGKAAKHFMWVPSWLRLKLDAMVMHSETHATVIDFKTGRKFGNEIKHGEQLSLYQLVTFLRYPKLEHVTAELWYLDQKPGENITSVQFTRAKGLKYQSNFDRRGHKLTTATDFPPNPNVHSCQWCQYGPWNGGQCQDGVRATPGKKK